MSEHPELQKALDEEENKTEEDKILEQLEIYLSEKIFGVVKIHGINSINPESNKVMEFFKREDIKDILKIIEVTKDS